MKIPCVTCLCLLSGLLLLPLPSVAHNGAVAIAVPVESMQIDGDLSDWPEGMRRYPILLPEVGDAPRDAVDFDASFRLGYNLRENALYVAVDVVDESYVIDSAGGAWNTQDGCEVYVDLQHLEQDSPAVQYNLFGREPSRRGPGGDEDFSVATQQGENRLFYEWRIDVGQIMSRGKGHLGPDQVVGFDVVVEDKDEDGSFSCMLWGRLMGTASATLPRGDALLVGEEGRLGKLLTSVRWEDAEEGVSHARVRIESLTSAGIRLQVEADRRGICEVELPEGYYRARVMGLRGSEGGRTASVAASEAAEIALPVEPPQGEVREAGPGKGHWRNLGPADGLPASGAWDMLQDRQGNLWLATMVGVSRYDGQEFWNLTTQDGLAHDQVHAIGEDREGNLWFGTGGGLSRFDGQHFQTFTTQHGLPSNMVFAIAADRQGYLWFGTDAGASRYDGDRFQTFTKQAGLVHDYVTSILTGVVTSRRLGPVEELSVPSSQEFLAFEFQGRSLATRPEGMAYAYRLAGYEEDWRPSYEGRAEYAGLPRGEYVFEVKAVDRDLNYSAPATVKVQVHLPYGRLGVIAALGLAIAQKSVELLGGNIAVESQVGKGTKFRVKLPARS